MSGEAPPGAATGQARAKSRDDSWTVLELLRWTQDHFAELGLDSPRLDAECLLAHALGVPRLQLYLDFEKPVMAAERAAFRELVVRRARERVPVAHLLETKEFWSLSLRVGPEVLVPRPDTETLVTAALDSLRGKRDPVRILELGTGSGAVSLALASERPGAVIFSTDISQEALNIAQQNAEVLGMRDRIHFLAADWTGPIGRGGFDCVVSNPPYLADGERAGLAPELAHEPDRALFAGPRGSEALEALCDAAPELLAPEGTIALELAPEQAAGVAERLAAAGLETAGHRDLAGRLRVVTGRAPAQGRAS